MLKIFFIIYDYGRVDQNSFSSIEDELLNGFNIDVNDYNDYAFIIAESTLQIEQAISLYKSKGYIIKHIDFLG